MNKKAYVAVLVLIGLLATALVGGCTQINVPDGEESEGGESEIEKPNVAYVPDGWYLSDDSAYPEFTGNGYWGLVEYTDEEDYDFVQIFYGDIPTELRGKERDGDALIGRAFYESSAFEPTESGTMTIGGWIAGYTRAYDADYDVYDMEIVFVNGSTCIDIYTCFDATTEDEAQVMAIIESIYF
jgi:hypothetical protein